MKVCSLEEPSVWLANGYPSVVRQETVELQWGVHFWSTYSYLLSLTKHIPGGIRTLGLLLRKQTPYHWATGTLLS